VYQWTFHKLVSPLVAAEILVSTHTDGVLLGCYAIDAANHRANCLGSLLHGRMLRLPCNVVWGVPVDLPQSHEPAGGRRDSGEQEQMGCV
jgi:hypothetical protein